MAENAKTLPEMKKLNRRQSEQARANIRVGNIITRLQKFVEGEVEMDGSQVRASEILLNKVLPNLTAAELSGSIETKTTATQETVDQIRLLQKKATEKQELTLQ